MKKRECYPDILRIAAALCVILQHSVNLYITYTPYYGSTSWLGLLVLNAFSRAGVPLFLMLSGMFLLADERSRDFGAFYRKRLPRILMPLLFWNIAYYAYYCLRGAYTFSVGDFFAKLLNNGSVYHLWYLYMLLGIYLMVPFLKRIADSCTERQLVWFGVLIGFCSTIRPFINQVFHASVYLFDPLAEGYLGFFLLGYLLSRLKTGRWMLPAGIASFLCGAALSTFGNYIASSPEWLDFPQNGGYALCQYLTAGGLFLLARVIFGEHESPKALSRIAELTFGTYFVHIAVLDFMIEYATVNASPFVSSLWFFLLTAVGSFALAFLLSLTGKIKKVFM